MIGTPGMEEVIAGSGTGEEIGIDGGFGAEGIREFKFQF